MLRQHVRSYVAWCVLVFFASTSGLVSGQDREALFPDPFPSTYQPFPSQETVISNATILTGTGDRIDGGSIVMRDGLIVDIGTNLEVPAGATVIDANGKWITPGIIDTHSHSATTPRRELPHRRTETR